MQDGLRGFSQIPQRVHQWLGLYMGCCFCYCFFNLVEQTDSATWGTPLLFLVLMSPPMIQRSRRIAPSKSLDSLPFPDVDIMEGEPKEDRTVNGEVSHPRLNLCHSPCPSNAQFPHLRRSHFIPSFTSPSSQDPSAEDVIFVHLNYRTLSEKLFTPTPLNHMHLFAETSIYEEFDVNQDNADPDLAPSFEHTECYKLKSYISFQRGSSVGTPSPPPKQPGSSAVNSAFQELQDHLQKSHQILVIPWLFYYSILTM